MAKPAPKTAESPKKIVKDKSPKGYEMPKTADYDQPYGMHTRQGRREAKQMVEIERMLESGRHRRALHRKSKDPNQKYRLTLQTIPLPSGISVRDYKLARAAAARQAARRQRAY